LWSLPYKKRPSEYKIAGNSRQRFKQYKIAVNSLQRFKQYKIAVNSLGNSFNAGFLVWTDSSNLPIFGKWVAGRFLRQTEGI
jgi:plasmid rolling circle replication initiator protein Rep